MTEKKEVGTISEIEVARLIFKTLGAGAILVLAILLFDLWQDVKSLRKEVSALNGNVSYMYNRMTAPEQERDVQRRAAEIKELQAREEAQIRADAIKELLQRTPHPTPSPPSRALEHPEPLFGPSPRR